MGVFMGWWGISNPFPTPIVYTFTLEGLMISGGLRIDESSVISPSVSRMMILLLVLLSRSRSGTGTQTRTDGRSVFQQPGSGYYQSLRSAPGDPWLPGTGVKLPGKIKLRRSGR